MTESLAHKKRKSRVAQAYLESGYRVSIEYVTEEGYILDVYAVNSQREVCVEVGRVPRHKAEWARENFDEFVHIGYKMGNSKVKKVTSSTRSIAIDDETNDKVEELQKQLPWSPTKKEIIGEAVKSLHNKKTEEGQSGNQTADNNN